MLSKKLIVGEGKGVDTGGDKSKMEDVPIVRRGSGKTVHLSVFACTGGSIGVFRIELPKERELFK